MLIFETQQVKNPLFALFAYYCYYLAHGDNAKYKSIVKFNLNHKGYFKKRDKIIEYVDNKEYYHYWQACILNTIAN